MSETLRNNTTTGSVSDDAHQTLLVDETNDKSNLHHPKKSHISGQKYFNDDDLEKKNPSSANKNQKSKINLNDRLIMIFVGIVGLIFLIVIALTTVFFFLCYSKTNQPRKPTGQYTTKTTDQFVSATTNGNESGNTPNYPIASMGRAKVVETVFVEAPED